MFFSKSTNGFYLTEFHGSNMPDDVVEITLERHTELLAGQEAGKVISSDADGNPILIDPPPPGYADLRAAEYPPMADYLDGIVKNDQEQIAKYIADCLAVKAKYPKPEV